MTALMGRLGEEAPERAHQPLMLIRDRVAHALEPAAHQILEHRVPTLRAFTRAEPRPQVLAIAIGPNADHPQHRRGAHLAFPPHLLDVGVEHEIGIGLPA